MKALFTSLLLATLISITSCSDNPCENSNCGPNAICNNATGDCYCLPGFSGSNCEIQDLCYSIDCTERGTCDEETGICDCQEGYFGDNCQFTLKDKFIGSWVSSNFICDTLAIENLSITFIDSSDIYSMLVIGLYEPEQSLILEVRDSSKFTIPSQAVEIDGLTWSRYGDGTIANDSLFINTVTTDGIETLECNGLFLFQE